MRAAPLYVDPLELTHSIPWQPNAEPSSSTRQAVSSMVGSNHEFAPLEMA